MAQNYQRIYPVGICLECKENKPIMAKGLCGRCYRRLWSRKKSGGVSQQEYFAKKATESKIRKSGICKTCGCKGKIQSLGQCSRCYKKTVGRVIKCAHCGNERKHEARGLCSSCYVNTITAKNKTKIVICAICGKEKLHKAKGLCTDCYRRQHKKGWEKKFIICSNCGFKSRHIANGLCDKCYRLLIFNDNERKYRRQKRLSELPATLTQGEWIDILERYNYNCAYCGKTNCELHKEHWIPVSKGGEYTKENIVPACKRCNSRKHTMTGDEFLEFLKKEAEWEAISKSECSPM